MADQQRWFKLWASAPQDDDLQRLSPAHRWAWVVFGLYTKVHGTRGRVTVSPSNVTLAAAMGVPVDVTGDVIKSFPHMTVEEGTNPSQALTVTWHNWHKYQEDTNMAERQRASRSKRRGEEKREEKKRIPPPSSPPEPLATEWKLNPALHEAVSHSRFVTFIADEAWWRSQFEAFEGVSYHKEVARAEAWCRSNPDRAPKKHLKRFLHMWFNRAQESAHG